MTDEFDRLDQLTDKLLASPQLLKAWRASSAIGYSYAWHLLNTSWQLTPEIPIDFIPHNPRLRLWDNASGWTDNEPYTLTVFGGLKQQTCCRHAVWHAKQKGESKDRFVQFFEENGQIQFFEPRITVRDADVPYVQLQHQLRAIAAIKVPAISALEGRTWSATSDVGSVGFDYFTHDQPPAGIKYEWSNRISHEWQPVIAAIEKLREFLFGCFR